ncbi:DUF4251 domain-containing protein [Winogradskyella sp. A3E31]|uniref:DUF4251 domain-containing protein n=1 Tax=Winogradskyella sp. A3E31 TaxID=3349637 RepID=UPI00398B2BEE
MKTYIYFLVCISLLLCSCASSKSKASPQDIENLKELVESQDFRIESDWAFPQTTFAVQQVMNTLLLPQNGSANRINLIGNSNFLEIKGDSVSSYLPYFGERQMNVQYGGKDSAIQLKGLMENFSVEEIKGSNYLIKFDAKSSNESFQVYLTLTPGLSSNLIVNSSSRRTIRYSGQVEPSEEEL